MPLSFLDGNSVKKLRRHAQIRYWPMSYIIMACSIETCHSLRWFWMQHSNIKSGNTRIDPTSPVVENCACRGQGTYTRGLLRLHGNGEHLSHEVFMRRAWACDRNASQFNCDEQIELVAQKVIYKRKDPTAHAFWNPPFSGPRNQNAGSSCLCGPNIESLGLLTSGKLPLLPLSSTCGRNSKQS